jgi:hypothetical protein
MLLFFSYQLIAQKLRRLRIFAKAPEFVIVIIVVTVVPLDTVG